MPFGYSFKPRLFVKNNARYNAVRNAATTYASVLNKYPLPARTPNAIKEINAAKSNLQLKINMYMENIPAGVPPPAPGRFAGLRARFARAPAPAPAPAPPAGGPVTNNRAPNTGNWPNGMYKLGDVDGKRTSVYKVGTDYYYLFSTNNGRETWVKVKRDGNSNKYNLNRTNGRYFVKTRNTNGRAVFTPMGNTNAKAAKYAKFKNFYNTTYNPTNPMAVLNAMMANPNANIRNFSANNNVNKNVNGRANFWKEVTTRRTAAMPTKGDLQKFKNWYVGLPSPTSNQARAKQYVNINQNNSQRTAQFGGVIIRANNTANNTNTSRKPFWDAVNAEMVRRAAGTA